MITGNQTAARPGLRGPRFLGCSAASGFRGPWFGKKDLRDIHEADIRRWRKERLDAGPHAARPFGPVTVAKAYRLLHAIMNTAVEDGLIRRNPCRFKGAEDGQAPGDLQFAHLAVARS